MTPDKLSLCKINLSRRNYIFFLCNKFQNVFCFQKNDTIDFTLNGLTIN